MREGEEFTILDSRFSSDDPRVGGLKSGRFPILDSRFSGVNSRFRNQKSEIFSSIGEDEA